MSELLRYAKDEFWELGMIQIKIFFPDRCHHVFLAEILGCEKLSQFKKEASVKLNPPMKKLKTEISQSTENFQKELHLGVFLTQLAYHPSLDTPEKKNQKTHLGDPKIYQVEGMNILKQEEAKSSYGRFFDEINSKTFWSNHGQMLKNRAF